MVRGDKHMVLIPINPTGSAPCPSSLHLHKSGQMYTQYVCHWIWRKQLLSSENDFLFFQGPESQSHIYSRFIQVKHFNYFNWTLISKLFLPHMQSHNFSRFCAMIFTNLDLHFSALVSWYIPPKNLQFDGIIFFPAHHQFWFWRHESFLQ